MKLKKLLSLGLSVVMLSTALSIPTFAEDRLIAFPGAEGGGMYTQGARAGENFSVYHVTNLNDSGAGSFRDAVSQGNRIIVFDVAGNIMLKSILKVKSSNLTILGQTAPGEGICIGGESVLFQDCDNIIIRYMRFRSGDTGSSQEDALGGKSCKNVIIDHCSVSWSVDECFSWYGNTNFTAQWNIISESLRISKHDKGEHGYGGLWGGTNASFHHNLIASHDSRNPRIATTNTVNSTPDDEATVDVRNNVIYNWKQYSGYGGENGIRVNFVNNYFKPTSSVNSGRKIFYSLYGGGITNIEGAKKQSTTLHISGNVMEGVASLTENNWLGVAMHDNESGVYWIKRENIDDEKGTVMLDNTETDIEVPDSIGINGEYLADYPVSTENANDAYDSVLENAGANIFRDSIDTRVVNDVENGTMPVGSSSGEGFIDSQEDVGGWVALHGTKPQDSDNDGISDEWENENGLNPNVDDSAEIAENGYTNIENYANYLATTTYGGYDVDITELKAEIAAANAIDQQNYSIADREKLQTAIDNAEKVYNLSAPTQEEIDNACEELKSVISSLVVDHTDMLKSTIAKAKALDNTQYTYETMVLVNEAVEIAENDIENSNSENYVADAEAIETAISGLKASSKPKLKGFIDFFNGIDFSYLTLKDRNSIKSQIKSAEDVYNNPKATASEVSNAIGDLYDIVRKGNYTRINQGFTLDNQDFESGEIYPEDDSEISNGYYSFVANDCRDISVDMDCMNTQIISGDDIPYVSDNVNKNHTNVMYVKIDSASLSSTDYMALYKKTRIMNDRHYIVSADVYRNGGLGFNVALCTDTDNIKYCLHDTHNYKNALEIITDRYTNLDGYNSFIRNASWNNYAIEVNKDTNTVTFYINNIPMYTGTVKKLPNFNGYAVATERSDNGIYVDNLKYVSLDSVYGETEYLYGDADNNGILTANDAAVVLQKTLDGDYITELENVCDDYLKYLDVDCNGILTANDAAVILQKTLSGDYLMPVETSTQQTTETTTESTTISTTISTTETTTETTTSANIKDYVVSGGAITFDTDTGSVIGYTGNPTYVIIPEEIDSVPIENIADSAFESCSSLKSITLPGTIKKLGYRVFTSCRKLENVVIQNGTEEIDATSFRNCTSLKRIEIPDSVTTINVTVWYSDVTIVCHAGSYAESYANSKGLKTEIIE